jgi:hypothetical protein
MWFATAWLTSGGTTRIRQNEHALESRILRGHTRLHISSNRMLELISGQHPVVNWGSQFPTKWERQGAARYLDAILRNADDIAIQCWVAHLEDRSNPRTRAARHEEPPATRAGLRARSYHAGPGEVRSVGR